MKTRLAIFSICMTLALAMLASIFALPMGNARAADPAIDENKRDALSRIARLETLNTRLEMLNEAFYTETVEDLIGLVDDKLAQLHSIAYPMPGGGGQFPRNFQGCGCRAGPGR